MKKEERRGGKSRGRSEKSKEVGSRKKWEVEGKSRGRMKKEERSGKSRGSRGEDRY